MKKDIFETPVEAKQIIVNPTFDELRNMASNNERTTEFGSASYISNIKSRSAKLTDIIYNDATPEQEKLIRKVMEHLKTRTLIQLDRQMCKKDGKTLHCRYYVPREFAQIPYAWGQTLFDCENTGGKPDIKVIACPDWTERRVLVDPKSHTTFVLGTDYIGEIKKANLRMAMYIAKQRGMLGLHAGSKEIYFKNNGKTHRKGAIFFGLSGTGKTTLTCHHHGLAGTDGVTIRQDDVIILQHDMYCLGTEDNFYIKTEGLEPQGQPLLYNAATSSRAILENIWVGEDGTVDFLNYARTSNGRAVVHRRDMDFTDDN
ncbi:MAG: phosphoenolpyruvate carboxykinase (ATP), partial [Vulcanimicrobiota bacterium]